jgi:hypothetical protein
MQQWQAQWVQLQVGSQARSCRLEAVQAVLQQLPGVDQVMVAGSTEDGWFCRDLDVLVQGTSGTLLLLDDEDDGEGMRFMVEGAAGPFESGPGTRQRAAGGAGRQKSGGTGQVPPAQVRQQHAVGGKGGSFAAAGGSGSSSNGSRWVSRILALLSQRHMCDALFKARALAARGGWVTVLSWQQLKALELVPQRQQEYLQEVLWLLLQRRQDQLGEVAVRGGLPAGEGGQQLQFVAGTPVAAAAAVDLRDD